MLICPVRHHSPAAALQVERLIREHRPQAVLVEGPADATDLIPLLLDPETEPPVALYVYRTIRSHDGGSGGAQPNGRPHEARVRAVYYPFCHYSPEYVALKVGQEVGARLLFCDVPATAALDQEGADDEAGGDEGGDGDRDGNGDGTLAGEAQPADGTAAATTARPPAVAGPPPTSLPGFGEFASAVAAASGFESFEAFWEAAFEQDAGARPPAEYVALLATFGGQARAFSTAGRDAYDGAREGHMAAAARALVESGVPADAIVLVCGAAHAAAVARFFDNGSPSPREWRGGQGVRSETQIALIPFSFPRLSEQLGYGAGNRAPWYYQQVWQAQGDYPAATRRGLLALARHLRTQGHTASLAQSIDAYCLAAVLAGMRQKRAPGVDELSDAAVACFGQGQPAVVAAALRRVLIGDALGRITPRVGRTPLQAEFYATARELGVPVLDAPRQVLLHMVAPREAAQSVFLHRLVVADIPFGRELESGLGRGGRAAAAQAEPLEQVARVREKWELQWTPATDAQLIERTAWGSTIGEVCARLLGERLAAAQRIDAGTAVLLKLALCGLADALPAALARCEALAADSASFPALARATYHVDGLLTYGAARRLPAARLGALAERLFARAALHLPAAAVCDDDAAADVRETLVALHDLVRRGSAAVSDPAAFWQSVEAVAALAGAHPALRGLALVLLELDGRVGRDELAARLRYWLSRAADAADNARLIAGLFSLHRGTLVRNRALVGAVTDFLLDLPIEQLTPLLPVLRRSLGNLSQAERTYLAETLAALLGVGAAGATRALTITSAEAALLREADAAVAAVLASWKERYGIG